MYVVYVCGGGCAREHTSVVSCVPDRRVCTQTSKLGKREGHFGVLLPCVSQPTMTVLLLSSALAPLRCIRLQVHG